MTKKMHLYTTNKKYTYKTSFPDDKEGVHFAEFTNKWIVRVWKKSIRGGLQLTSLAAYQSKEDADLAFQNYQQTNVSLTNKVNTA